MAVKIIVAIVIIAVVIFILMEIISRVVSNKLIHPKRTLPSSNPEKELGLKYSDAEFISEGNIIKGWYVPSDENRYNVVYAHGYHENRESLILPAYNMMEFFHEDGANFFTFDFSGHGESGGDFTTCGYREKYDLLNAVKYVKSKNDRPIILYGISMGAATTILSLENNRDIIAAICDSPFSSLKEYLESNLGVWIKLPKYPFYSMVLNRISKDTGVSLDAVSPINAIRKTDVPVLLIHGEGDDCIPYTESVKLKEASVCDSELKIMKNKGHCQSLRSFQKEYKETVKDFVYRKLGEKYD